MVLHFHAACRSCPPMFCMRAEAHEADVRAGQGVGGGVAGGRQGSGGSGRASGVEEGAGPGMEAHAPGQSGAAMGVRELECRVCCNLPGCCAVLALPPAPRQQHPRIPALPPAENPRDTSAAAPIPSRRTTTTPPTRVCGRTLTHSGNIRPASMRM